MFGRCIPILHSHGARTNLFEHVVLVYMPRTNLFEHLVLVYMPRTIIILLTIILSLKISLQLKIGTEFLIWMRAVFLSRAPLTACKFWHLKVQRTYIERLKHSTLNVRRVKGISKKQKELSVVLPGVYS